MKSSSRLTLAMLAMTLAVPLTAVAQERLVSPEELKGLVVGKKIQDVDRADHWVTFAPDGTAVGASRGREFDMTYELHERGWCREIKPRGGSSGDRARYRKCQDITYDGTFLYFYDENGPLAGKYRIE